jgi:hypothetical protein
MEWEERVFVQDADPEFLSILQSRRRIPGCANGSNIVLPGFCAQN